jgi:hypothetical protein
LFFAEAVFILVGERRAIRARTKIPGTKPTLKEVLGSASDELVLKLPPFSSLTAKQGAQIISHMCFPNDPVSRPRPHRCMCATYLRGPKIDQDSNDRIVGVVNSKTTRYVKHTLRNASCLDSSAAAINSFLYSQPATYFLK